MIHPTTSEELLKILEDYELSNQDNQQVEVITYEKMSREERDITDYIVGELDDISHEDAVKAVAEIGIAEASDLGSTSQTHNFTKI